MSQQKPLVQWTILELVSVVTIGTLVVGGMWAPPLVFWFAGLVAMALVLGMGTIALTGRGEWRRFAAAFTMVVVAYIALGMLGYADRLPTHEFWLYLQPSLTRAEYREDSPPSGTNPVVYQSGIIYDETGKRLGSLRGANRQITVTPPNQIYIQAGHLFGTLLLAYLAGKFAVGFGRYQDRPAESPTTADQGPLSSPHGAMP